MTHRNILNVRSWGRLVLCMFAMGVLTYGTAAQQRLAPPAPDHDPAVGMWKVNPDKSNPKLTAKDVWCEWGADRKGEPCTVAVSREGNVRVPKIIAIGLTTLKSARNEPRAQCDGQRHMLEDQTAGYAESDIFRAGDAGEMPGPAPEKSGNEPPSRSYMICSYVTPSLVDGETGIDPHDPGKNGTGTAFFFGPVTYWREAVSPDGQELAYFEYKDKSRTKIKRMIVSDRIK